MTWTSIAPLDGIENIVVRRIGSPYRCIVDRKGNALMDENCDVWGYVTDPDIEFLDEYSTLSPKDQPEGQNPLTMLLEFENHGNKMEVHCPDEDDEMTVTVIDEDAGEPANYALTLDEAEELADYLLRHVKNSRDAAIETRQMASEAGMSQEAYDRQERQGEIPEEIESVLKNLARSAWQFARNAHRLYPDNKHTFSDYSATTLPKDLEPAIACYHKMQEEIKEYRKALQNFVDKVDRGEARSKRSYAEMKDILAKYPQGKEGGK